MPSNVNRACIVGNLTRDPELRSIPSGTSVCEMRVAVNSRVKRGEEWVDKPNYFNVTVWGKQGENCAQYLSKGSPVAVDGRLDWREWEDKETGKHREAVQIVAEAVQFLPSKRKDGGSSSGGSGGGGEWAPAPESETSGDPIPF